MAGRMCSMRLLTGTQKGKPKSTALLYIVVYLYEKALRGGTGRAATAGVGPIPAGVFAAIITSGAAVQQRLGAVVAQQLLLHIVVAHLLQAGWGVGWRPVQKRPFSGHHDHDSYNLRLRPGQQGQPRSRRLCEKPIGRSPFWIPAKTAEVKQEPQNGSRVGITARDHRVSTLSLGWGHSPFTNSRRA